MQQLQAPPPLQQQQTFIGSTIHRRMAQRGISDTVFGRLLPLLQQRLVGENDLDDRALDRLATISPETAVAVLDEFAAGDVAAVDASSRLCKIIQSYGAGASVLPPPAAAAAGAVKVEEAQGGGGSGEDAIAGGGIAAQFVAPDPDRVKTLTDRTGYAMTVTPGQRKYGGPPPNWEADRPPGDGCEVKNPVKGISTSYT